MKRALLVGIDAYQASPLAGCVADAQGLSDVLVTNYDRSPNWRCQVLLGEPGEPPITRDDLRGHLARLFENARESDLLFYFAGHGAQTQWGAEIVTQDARQYSLGVSMNDLVTLANDSPALSVTLILDCCFSGDAGQVPGLQPTSVAEPYRLGKTLLRENVTILAASRSAEAAAETSGNGAFTRVLIDGLLGGATDHRGNVTALGLYGYISGTFDDWEQRPILKTSLTSPLVIRVGPPWIDVELLRSMPVHFPTADARVTLTPAHEGEGRPLARTEDGTQEQQEFDYLGRLRNANLVTTDGRRDHYWVAMENGDVYLTPLGQYFWRLADRGVL